MATWCPVKPHWKSGTTGRSEPYRGAFPEAPGAGSDTKWAVTILASSLRAMLRCTFPEPIIKSNQFVPYN